MDARTNNVYEYIRLGLTHSIHTSERKSFRGCRRRWNWIFREFYYPTTTAKPLEFGTAYHKAMEVYYEPSTWRRDPSDRSVLANAAVMAFKQTCEKQKVDFINATGGIEEEANIDYAERVELGLGMLHHHLRELSPTLDGYLKPIKVEIPFEVPITDENGNQIWCKCSNCKKRWQTYQTERTGLSNHPAFLFGQHWDGLPVTYGGRLDAIMQDENGDLWVYDWKTAARLNVDNDEFLLIDDQISSYCWAMWLIGIPVKGFIYHEQKKGFPEQPEPMKVKRLGRMFSTSKSANFIYDQYLETVREHDPFAYDNGLYDEYLEWLKEEGGVFHHRYTVTRNETELRQTGYNIYLEAMDIIDQELRIYPNSGRFGCTYCAFRQPCIGQNMGEDYQYALDTMYEKRSYHYWEEKKPSTDSKAGE